MRRHLRALLPVVLLASAPVAGARAQSVDVPPTLQASLMLKVLSFDRSMGVRTNGDLVVGIVYQSGFRGSQSIMDEVAVAMRKVRPTGLRIVPIDLDRESLAAVLARGPFYAVYVTPMRAVDIGEIGSACRRSKVTTFTGVPSYVEQGLAVGVRLEGDRPRLLINVQQAKNEGADFSAELLKLAQVVR